MRQSGNRTDHDRARRSRLLARKRVDGRLARWRLVVERNLMRRLAPLAPGLAAALAERAFLTPWHFQQPEAERHLLTRGRRFVVRYRFAGERRRIATWSFGDGPAVLLTHGWAGRGGQLRAFVEPLVARGFSVILFDAPAHGQSPGQRSAHIEFAHAIRAIDRQIGPVRAVIAHSLGGSAAAYATKLGLTLDRLVVIGTPCRAEDALTRFGALHQLPPPVVERLRDRIERRYGIRFADIDVRKMADPGVQLLVAHDRDDPDVPFADGAAIADAWPGAELIATQGLGHRRILRDQAVVTAVVDFVDAGLTARKPAATPAVDEAFPRYELVATPGC